MNHEALRVLKQPLLPPSPVRMGPLRRMRTTLSTLWIDHAVFRYFHNTRHRVAPGVYRSGHPLPSQLRAAARIGIRTVVNLRGVDSSIPANRLSWEVCAGLGLRQVHFQLYSRRPPTREEIFGLKALFDSIERPFLMHCKAGADRVGLASVLYLLMVEKQPLEQALQQLDFWRFGHVRQAKTGVLDYFFDCYRRHRDAHGTAFEDWVMQHYDPAAVAAAFRSRWWANQLVDWVLRRE